MKNVKLSEDQGSYHVFVGEMGRGMIDVLKEILKTDDLKSFHLCYICQELASVAGSVAQLALKKVFHGNINVESIFHKFDGSGMVVLFGCWTLYEYPSPGLKPLAGYYRKCSGEQAYCLEDDFLALGITLLLYLTATPEAVANVDKELSPQQNYNKLLPKLSGLS